MINYHAYLLTPAWRKRRSACLRQYDYRCAICNGTDNLQAHHRTYQNIGRELPGDLVCLCDQCHELVSHRMQDRPFKFLERLGWLVRSVVK